MTIDEINFSKQEYKPGALICKDIPLVAVIQDSLLQSICSKCFESSIMKCSACKTVTYCSKTCQKADFKQFHKLECKSFQKVFPNKPNWMMRLLARILFKIHKSPEVWTEKVGKDRHEQDGLKRLQTHRKELPAEKIGVFAELAMGMQLFVEREYLLCPSDLIDLLCLINCNSLSVTDDEQEVIGVCISTKIAMLNHSCIPNASVVFSNGEAIVLALQSIKTGDELFISYIDHTQTTISRKSALKQNYLFDCNCRMCCENLYIDPLEKFTTKWNELLACSDWQGAATLGIEYCKKLENLFGSCYPRVGVLQFQIFRCSKLIPDYEISIKYGLLAIENMPQYMKLFQSLQNEYADWRRSITAL